MDKTIVLWTQNYGTIPRTMELYELRRKKSMVDYQKLRNFDLQWNILLLNSKRIEVSKQIYSFRSLIYFGKLLIQWNNFAIGAM